MIVAHVATLDEHANKVHELYIVKGFSQTETAAILDITTSSIARLVTKHGWAKPMEARPLLNRPKNTTPRPPTDRVAFKCYPVGPNAATLTDLPAAGCRWPVGEPPEGGLMFDQLFCGELRSSSGHYCGNHDDVAHGRASGRK